MMPPTSEWAAATALRKTIEDVFYLFKLMGNDSDADKAEVMLRRAAMEFDRVVERDEWDKEEK